MQTVLETLNLRTNPARAVRSVATHRLVRENCASFPKRAQASDATGRMRGSEDR